MGVLGGLILRAGGFSPEAQAVINRMTGLTDNEKTYISTFVDAEVANGNWTLIDEFWCFGLVTAANALVGWISKTATNNGATKTANGFSFNGTSDYIDSNYNPNVDSINYVQDDAMIEAYMYSTSSEGVLMGALAGENVQMRQRTTGQFFNSGTFNQSVAIQALDLASFSRINSTNVTVRKNGVTEATPAIVSTGIPTGSFYIGARSGGTALYFGGVLSTVLIGAAIGFDHSSHNTNINTLLTSLGVI